jgi:hypothetical protein
MGPHQSNATRRPREAADDGRDELEGSTPGQDGWFQHGARAAGVSTLEAMEDLLDRCDDLASSVRGGANFWNRPPWFPFVG